MELHHVDNGSLFDEQATANHWRDERYIAAAATLGFVNLELRLTIQHVSDASYSGKTSPL